MGTYIGHILLEFGLEVVLRIKGIGYVNKYVVYILGHVLYTRGRLTFSPIKERLSPRNTRVPM